MELLCLQFISVRQHRSLTTIWRHRRTIYEFTCRLYAAVSFIQRHRRLCEILPIWPQLLQSANPTREITTFIWLFTQTPLPNIWQVSCAVLTFTIIPEAETGILQRRQFQENLKNLSESGACKCSSDNKHRRSTPYKSSRCFNRTCLSR